MKKIDKMDEKYRPTKFNQVIGNRQVVETIAYMVEEDKTIPHILMSGPAGTGKTTLALTICYEMFGKFKKQNVLELNASVDNSVKVVREKIKDKAKYANASSLSGGEFDFIVIILDEFDYFSPNAQGALRRVMEKYADRCRFILCCNFINKVIDPIRSRCTEFKMEPISNEDMYLRAEEICEEENIHITPEALKYVIEYSRGDMRKVLNTLEMARSYKSDNPVEIGFFTKVTGGTKKYLKLLKYCLDQKIKIAYDFIIRMLSEGYEMRDIVKEVGKESMDLKVIPATMKAHIALAGFRIEQQMLLGADPINTAMAYIGELVILGKKYKPKKK